MLHFKVSLHHAPVIFSSWLLQAPSSPFRVFNLKFSKTTNELTWTYQSRTLSHMPTLPEMIIDSSLVSERSTSWSWRMSAWVTFILQLHANMTVNVRTVWYRTVWFIILSCHAWSHKNWKSVRFVVSSRQSETIKRAVWDTFVISSVK